jgi:prolyl-tRNA editing enzyme YbaK/EbsC (Cys-tRNA(Pro) deacylase)
VAICEEEEARELTGMAIGGVTVIALPKDLPIYVDEGLMEFDYVILGSGDRSAKIKISPEVFFACRTCKSSWVSPCRGLSDPVDASIG